MFHLKLEISYKHVDTHSVKHAEKKKAGWIRSKLISITILGSIVQHTSVLYYYNMPIYSQVLCMVS